MRITIMRTAILCISLCLWAATAHARDDDFTVIYDDGAKKQAEIDKATSPEKSAQPKLSPEDKTLLAKAETYLTELTTIIADFVQVAPDGSIAGGTFYLKRPNKMRWQYDPPTPILMVTQGSMLTYYDYELEQVSDIPIADTLVGFLARENIRFDDSVKVMQVEENTGAIRITLIQTERPTDGKLTLEFSNRPLEFRNFVVTDSQGQVTTISLNNARYGAEINDQLFVFDDPRKGGRRTRKDINRD